MTRVVERDGTGNEGEAEMAAPDGSLCHGLEDSANAPNKKDANAERRDGLLGRHINSVEQTIGDAAKS